MTEKKKEAPWRTALTKIEPGKILVRGRAIDELMKESSFSDAIYLLLKGSPPPANHRRAMNAILVSSIDHGVTPPSSLAARMVVSGGNPLNSAVAGGILTIGDSHGGAIEQCARILQERAQDGRAGQVAAEIVEEFRSSKRRLPGFGHRLHAVDPRSRALLDIAREDGLDGKYVELALAVEKELFEKTGRRLPLNVDGAIAALISEMGFDWRMGKGFFIISRTPGLVAHAFEENSREKPMRRIGSFEAIYDGPEEKS